MDSSPCKREGEVLRGTILHVGEPRSGPPALIPAAGARLPQVAVAGSPPPAYTRERRTPAIRTVKVVPSSGLDTNSSFPMR